VQSTVWTGLLLLNAAWFALGARFFCLDSLRAARLLVAKTDRASPLLPARYCQSLTLFGFFSLIAA